MTAHKTIGATLALALALGLGISAPSARAGTDIDGDQLNVPFNPGYIIQPGATSNCRPQPNETVICGEGNQATEFTFAVPIKLPGNVILPAGKYRFVLNNWEVNSNTVTILNDNWDLVRIVTTIPIERSKPTDETMLAFAGVPGQLPALTKWFFHGQTEGHEFVYPGQEGKALSEEPEVTIVAQLNPGSSIKSANLSARANY